MKEKIGFIGLGIMGRPMAKNLLNAGYELVVMDINKESVAELSQLGAQTAQTPSEIAEKTKIIITMLPDGPDVEKVVLGKDGIIEKACSETCLIDMSSISPTVSIKITESLAKKGCRCLDAPVSGGEPGAIKGELVIMAGGSESLFEEMKPVFDVLGKSAVLVGDAGAGQITKLVNQILVGIHIEAMGEAFILASKAGVNIGKVFDAIKGGLAGSSVLNAKFPKLAGRDFNPGFRINLHQKDIKNALETAESLGLDLPVTKTVKGMLDSLVTDGKGGNDHSGIVDDIEKLNGVIIK